VRAARAALDVPKTSAAVCVTRVATPEPVPVRGDPKYRCFTGPRRYGADVGMHNPQSAHSFGTV
jgi:hypothetical protein